MSSERDLERPTEGGSGDPDGAPASEALPLTTLTRAAQPDAAQPDAARPEGTRSLDRDREDAEVSMTRSALVSGSASAPDGRDDDLGAPPRLFQPGELVDHFEVIELLGEGGMGAVYLAVDTKLGRRVALKVVQRSHLGSAKAVESFLYEARTTARFSHPHIVTVYAVGEHRGSPYVALEYLEGQTLQDVLRAGRLTLEPALRIALAVAEALKEAHAHDVLHRDLKPANIVIPKDGRVRVLDFGLAKRIEGEAPPSMRFVGFGPREYTWAGAGTPAYMAPEQWRAEETTVATDVWAMGVLLFELCAGRRPFDEPSLVEQERVVCGDDLAPQLERFTSVPAELADLVARCLGKEPSERPSVTAIADEIRRMLGEPQRLHFDGTRSTLRPPDSPVVSVSGDAHPTAPTLLLDSDGRSQAEVGTAETMLDAGSDPGIAGSSPGEDDAPTRPAGEDELDTRTSPSAPPASRRSDVARGAPPSSLGRTLVVAAIALVIGGGGVWLVTQGPDAEVEPPAPAPVAPTEAPRAPVEPSPELSAVTATEAASDELAGSAAVPTGDASAPAAAPAAPPRPATPVLPPFDDAAAQTTLQRKAKSAELACRFHDGPRAFAVEVTFVPSGRAVRVRLNYASMIDAGASGRCVMGIMHGASVPAFRGDSQTRTIGVALAPKL